MPILSLCQGHRHQHLDDTRTNKKDSPSACQCPPRQILKIFEHKVDDIRKTEMSVKGQSKEEILSSKVGYKFLTIQLLTRIIVMNVATQITAKQLVSTILDTPKYVESIKRKTDLVA